MNRCPLDTFLPPCGNLVPVMINRRNSRCTASFYSKYFGDDGLIGNSLGLVQPTDTQGDGPELPGFPATYKAACGNLTVGLSRPHVYYNLTYLVHLEPPIGHGELPPHLKINGQASTPSLRDPKPNFKIRLAPLADPGMAPLADHQLAPLSDQHWLH